MRGDSVRVIKVDVDKNPEAAAHFGVQGVPTLILFRKGQQLWRQSGAMSATQLDRIIREKI
jgi:thioredoxin 1